MARKIIVPVCEKAMLSVRECAEYSGLGIHKIQNLCTQSDCEFVVKNGNRFLIKREEFDMWVRKLKEV